MNISSLIIVFSMTWWMIFFMSLPIGVKKPTKVEEGCDPGAPEKSNILLKMIISTILAIIITGLYFIFGAQYIDN